MNVFSMLRNVDFNLLTSMRWTEWLSACGLLGILAALLGPTVLVVAIVKAARKRGGYMMPLVLGGTGLALGCMAMVIHLVHANTVIEAKGGSGCARDAARFATEATIPFLVGVTVFLLGIISTAVLRMTNESPVGGQRS